MSEEKSSYRQIMKATSIFGGVQVFNIIIQLLRSKAIAILLGPAGMGFMGLLQTTVSLVGAATNFGLSTSAVRDISEANGTGDQNKVNETVSLVRRLVWLSGLLGLIVMVALSPLLSKLTFGNYNYTIAFIILAISLLISQLSAEPTAVLQGLRKIAWLAKANVYGSATGLVATIPMYYFFGTAGIVPSIVLASICSYAPLHWFSRKIQIEQISIPIKDAINQGKPMLKLGFFLSLSGLITVAGSYIIRIYITRTGSLADVGLYNAGFAIIGTYVGLIFTAMGTDYYPRLSAVAKSNKESKIIINQQAEIALLILAPIIIVFLVFIRWVVILLYSKQFSGVNEMILFAALGMFFKATSWAIAFLFLAKGASRLFFWNELATNIYLLGLNIIGYHFWGLTGLGISFLAAYLLYAVQVYLIARVKYNFELSQDFVVIFVLQIILAITCLALVKMAPNFYSYTIGSVIILLSSLYSLKELDKRLDLKSLMYSIKGKFK